VGEEDADGRFLGTDVLEFCDALLGLPLQLGGVLDDLWFAHAILPREASVERRNQIVQVPAEL
jgi:hypothetical protein